MQHLPSLGRDACLLFTTRGRSAAAGVTGIARSVGAALAPLASAPLIGSVVLASLPFILSGGLKIVYDVLLYQSFMALPAPEEEITG